MTEMEKDVANILKSMGLTMEENLAIIFNMRKAKNPKKFSKMFFDYVKSTNIKELNGKKLICLAQKLSKDC